MHDVRGRHIRATSVPQIGEDRVIDPFMRLGVAKDAVIDSLVEGVENRGSRGEIHVGYPERVEFWTAVVFDAAGSPAFDWRFEVEIHYALFLEGVRGRYKLGISGA